MKRVTAAKMAEKFDEYLSVSQNQPILVTKRGKPIAVLVSVRDETAAERTATSSPRPLRELLEKAHRQIEEGKLIPQDEFWRQVAAMRNDEGE